MCLGTRLSLSAGYVVGSDEMFSAFQALLQQFVGLESFRNQDSRILLVPLHYR